MEAFMEIEDHEIIQLELKYCERCGGLWLRLEGAPEVYCAPCALEMQQLPAPRRMTTRPRVPGDHKLAVKAQAAGWTMICGTGGNA
jgi:Zn-finger nucleic acid-binding protein